MENVRNHRDIKMVTTNQRKWKLMSNPNYHTSKPFFKKLNGNRNEKNKGNNE